MAGKTTTLSFKGKPLVRSGNVLYYGDPTQKYIAMLQVMGEKQFEDMKLSDKVAVFILSTDDDKNISQRAVKRTEKNGLYSALSIASIWLERALAK